MSSLAARLVLAVSAVAAVAVSTTIALGEEPPPAGVSWVRRYSGYPAWPTSAAPSPSTKDGNVFVAGTGFGGPETGVDYAILKYDPAGNLLWARRYNGVTRVNGEMSRPRSRRMLRGTSS